MGKALGRLIGGYFLDSTIERIDAAVAATDSGTRSKFFQYVIKDWLDRNGF